jgi:malate:Na+ symporter
MQQSVSASASPQSLHSVEPWWPYGWWKIVDMRIGIIPVPIYIVLVGLLAGFTYTGDIKGEVSMMIAVLVIGGFTCAEIGKRTPVLRNIGAAAIFATFVPSALAYYKLLPPQIEKSIIEFTKYTNFLYLFIACIIVGSILGMDRRVLVKGFLKIFVPLAVGSIVAAIVGTFVGTLLGLGAYRTFFFVVVPIMAGGVGEGAIPLSIGYSEILGQPQGDVFAQVLPPVMLGSLRRSCWRARSISSASAIPSGPARDAFSPASTTTWIPRGRIRRTKKARPSTSARSLPPAWQRLRSISWALCATACSACLRRSLCCSSRCSRS